MTQEPFPKAGLTYLVSYPGMKASNAYHADGKTLRYEFTDGPAEGASAVVAFKWKRVGEGVYLISWQESDGATVVHLDDFENGRSDTFFTTSDLDFHRLEGTLEVIGSRSS